VVVHAVYYLVRLPGLDRIAGHAGQVTGVVQPLADDQQLRADLVDQVPHRGVHGGEVGLRRGPPRRPQRMAAHGRVPRLVLDVHRGDERVRRVAPGDVLPGRGELRLRPA